MREFAHMKNIEDDFNNYIGLILDALIRAPETLLKNQT